MNNKDNQKIFENVKLKISISNFEEKENIEKKSYNSYFAKIASVACCLIVLTSGIVFAKDIERFIKYCFGDFNGLITGAAEKGYVEDVNMNTIEKDTTLLNAETGTIIDDIDVKASIDEFLMDDINLSTNFSFSFDEKVKDEFDLNNIQRIYLTDLMIIDNENRIIASNCSKIDFEKICKEYNLNYVFEEFVSGMPRVNGSVLNINKNENLIKYNLTCESSNEFFPNSKELNIIFKKIRLEKYEEYTGQDVDHGEHLKLNSVILTGDWKINIKVPEKMYNREKIEYKAIENQNPLIDVTYVRVSESGFKFKALITDTKQIEYYDSPAGKENLKLKEQEEKGEISLDEVNKKMQEWYSIEENSESQRKWKRENDMLTTHFIYFEENEEEIIDKITHLTDSKGKKYEIGDNFISHIKDNIYEFNATFNISKYDVTDKLTVTIIYYGEPINIELERIK